MYGNNADIARSIHESSFTGVGLRQDQISAIPRILDFVHLGGPLGADYQSYLLANIVANTPHPTTIWIDSESLLLNKTKRLIYGAAEALSNGGLKERRNYLIQQLKGDFYQTLKNAIPDDREKVWIKWLVRNCEVSKDELVSDLANTRNQLATLPSTLQSTANVQLGPIEVRDIRPLLAKYASDNPNNLGNNIEQLTDETLFRALSPACFSDVARNVIKYEKGGTYPDTDMLTNFNHDLISAATQAGESIPELDNSDELNAVVIQSFVFSRHPEWFGREQNSFNIPDRYRNTTETNNALETIINNLGINNLTQLFAAIPEIYVSRDLFLKPSGNNNVLACHPRARAVKLVIDEQLNNLDIQRKFEDTFQEHCLSTRPEISTANDHLAERHIFLHDQFLKDNSNIKMDVGDSLVHAPYDGLIEGLGSVIKLTGPAVYDDIISEVAKEQMQRNAYPFGSHLPFCERTILDYQSSWANKFHKMTQSRVVNRTKEAAYERRRNKLKNQFETLRKKLTDMQTLVASLPPTNNINLRNSVDADLVMGLRIMDANIQMVNSDRLSIANLKQLKDKAVSAALAIQTLNDRIFAMPEIAQQTYSRRDDHQLDKDFEVRQQQLQEKQQARSRRLKINAEYGRRFKDIKALQTAQEETLESVKAIDPPVTTAVPTRQMPHQAALPSISAPPLGLPAVPPVITSQAPRRSTLQNVLDRLFPRGSFLRVSYAQTPQLGTDVFRKNLEDNQSSSKKQSISQINRPEELLYKIASVLSRRLETQMSSIVCSAPMIYKPVQVDFQSSQMLETIQTAKTENKVEDVNSPKKKQPFTVEKLEEYNKEFIAKNNISLQAFLDLKDKLEGRVPQLQELTSSLGTRDFVYQIKDGVAFVGFHPTHGRNNQPNPLMYAIADRELLSDMVEGKYLSDKMKKRIEVKVCQSKTQVINVGETQKSPKL